MKPSAAFVSYDDLVFRFHSLEDAKSFASTNKSAALGTVDKHNVHVHAPSSLRHVRAYPGKGVIGLVFYKKADRDAFLHGMGPIGDLDTTVDQSSWRVFVPHTPGKHDH